MKKVIISLCLIVCVLMLFVGCGEEKLNSNANQGKKIEAVDEKRSREIREIAYEGLSQGDKNTVVDRESAEVEEYKATTDHSVASENGAVSLRDRDTYRVIFRTNNEAILGPIQVYIDKKTYKFLGIDLRD